MARIVTLEPDDVLVVRVRNPDDHDLEESSEQLSRLAFALGVKAIIVLGPGESISTLPADEVRRALAGA